MKVLIEISNEDMDKVQHSDGALFADVYKLMANTIRNGTPLNGTNGEVLKAVFPNMIIVEDTEHDCLSISNDFWNAEYKGGGVMYGSILVNGIKVACYPNNDGGFWYFHPVTGEIIEVEG